MSVIYFLKIKLFLFTVYVDPSCEASTSSLGAKKRKTNDGDQSENQQPSYDTTSESESESLNPLVGDVEYFLYYSLLFESCT